MNPPPCTTYPPRTPPMAIPPRPPLCPHSGTASKATLNAAMNNQRRIPVLSLQIWHKKRGNLSKDRHIIDNAAGCANDRALTALSSKASHFDVGSPVHQGHGGQLFARPLSCQQS